MNLNWVGFGCRVVGRRAQAVREVRCPGCGQPCRPAGTKIRFPPRHHVRAWLKLREWLAGRRLADRQRAERMQVARRHLLERQLTTLVRRPADPGRDRAIHQLRRRLAGP